MADSTTNIPQVVAGAGAAAQVNSNFDAASPAMLYGRNPATTTGLTWGYLGGRYQSTAISNGTVSLTASQTNYVVAARSNGAVSVSTSNTNWNNTTDYMRLYLVVTGTSSITSYEDHRSASGGGSSGGGSLTNWTEAKSTASPNATTPVSSFTPSDAATDADAAIIPKGNGALLSQVPTSSSAGGNKRGQYAVDFQRVRSAANQVASGNYAVAFGSDNRADGSYSVAIGTNNVASSTAAFAVGSSNTANGSGAAAIGNNNSATGTAPVALGNSNTASASNATAIGSNNVADAQYSTALGFRAIARGIIGYFARASGLFANPGDAQSGYATLRITTSDATPASLTTNASAGGTTNQIILPNTSAYVVRGRVVARQQATGDAKTWEFSCGIKRGANAAATAMIAACTPVVIAQDAGATAWALSVTADTSNGGLQIRATGEAAKTIRWVATVDTTEVVG